MKKLFALTFMTAAFCAAGPIIGFEDWKGPASDHDFNDLEYTTTGILFHTYSPYIFLPPAGYSETPFPAPAQYFNYGIAIGGQEITFLSSQTSDALDALEISVGGGSWVTVGTSLTISALLGQRIDFRLNNGSDLLYADPAKAHEFFGYGVVHEFPPPPPNDPGGPTVPEPQTYAMIGSGLVGVAVWRRKR